MRIAGRWLGQALTAGETEAARHILRCHYPQSRWFSAVTPPQNPGLRIAGPTHRIGCLHRSLDPLDYSSTCRMIRTTVLLTSRKVQGARAASDEISASLRHLAGLRLISLSPASMRAWFRLSLGGIGMCLLTCSSQELNAGRVSHLGGL